MRPIPGHPNYFATERGEIVSAKSGNLKPLRPFARSRSGHLAVNLTQRGRYRLHYVHRLIALAFIGIPPNGTVVMHRDDDPSNNAIENLRYGTPLENSEQMTARGRQARGERCGRSRLSTETVIAIRAAHSNGERTSDIARKFAVGESTVRDIWSRKHWRHI